MFSRLAQGVNSVLQELSGEERPDEDSQDGLVPQLQSEEDMGPNTLGSSEDTVERLAQLEQLVVQLKELIREKDSQLATAEKKLKEEKESGEAKFTKLKLQAKAKMAALNKQITELKGQEGANVSQSSDSSFTMAPGVEEELQQLKVKLSEEESTSTMLREQLEAAEQLLRDKEESHAEQVRKLQGVVSEKDMRFQEQIQKHEEELLRVSTESNSDAEQAPRAAQRRIEELEESLRSRSEVLEMLQQELNSADQQKQILTAQFRQMEQELREATRVKEEERQQWAQQLDKTEAELGALKDRLEASERDREEALKKLEAEIEKRVSEQEELRETLSHVGRERDLWMEKGKDAETELAILRANLETSQKEKEEITKRLEIEVENRVAELQELQQKLESMEREREEGSKEEGEELAQLQMELASLRERLDTEKEEQGTGLKAKEALQKLWKGLHSLTGADAEGEEETSIPTDPTQYLAVLPALEARLDKLKVEEEEREARMAQVNLSLDSLQGKLDESIAEREEAVSRIQQLEKELSSLQAADDSSRGHVIDLSVKDLDTADKGVHQEGHDSSNAHEERVLILEQQLFERERELQSLRVQLAQTEEQNSVVHPVESACYESSENFTVKHDSTACPADILEDTPVEETTLVAVDSSLLSISADTENTPEFTGQQTELLGESKGASSDEMVTSSDSEVAHSSWTLLEAVKQDGAQEWPPLVQDFGQLHLQSWEERSTEQDRSITTIVQVEQSTVEVQQGTSLIELDSASGQAFEQTMAEELHRRYSDLLTELEELKKSAVEYQEKISQLQEEVKLQSVAKGEAESKAQSYEHDLKVLRAEVEREAQKIASEVEEQRISKKILEQQLESLQTEVHSNVQKIQTLQAQLDEAQHSLTEQEGQARMLNAQLEDRELTSSDLEKKVIEMEAKILEVSQEADLAKSALSEKAAELEDLQLRLSQKEKEMMELSDCMSNKLLQAGEEKFLISNEVKKLKEQMLELESAWHHEQGAKGDNATEESEELATLRKDKEDLAAQVATMKKEAEQNKRKLQAALVQRKELMKKVAEFEKLGREREDVQDLSTSFAHEERDKKQEIQKLEALLEEARQALKVKEEECVILEQKMCNQDQMLAEANTENQRLSEEVAKIGQSQQQTLQTGEDNARLQSQVASMELELETLQKKLQEAVDSRKDTIRKAKEKDRHHREQLKQQKDEYNELRERFEAQSGEKEGLLSRLKELEDKFVQNLEVGKEKSVHVGDHMKSEAGEVAKVGAGDWVQDDWVDFAEPESELQQQDKPAPSTEQSKLPLAGVDDAALNALREEVKAEQAARMDLETRLQESQISLSFKETELLELSKELEALKEKESQIDVLSNEVLVLREKCLQAENHAEMLKVEIEAAAAKGSISDSDSSIAGLQAELEEFKQFLKNKNDEIIDLSQQLGEQNSLLQNMQETVSEKDQFIASLQAELNSEREKIQRLEAEIPQRQEEEKGSSVKLQQLQRKLQAALVSRKEVLKENQALKEEQTAAENTKLELQQKLEEGQAELNKLRAERERLIAEVDRTLLENQSLSASCESLKLAMEGVLNEKGECKRQAESAKAAADQASREWEEKVQSMKDEYETLLKSYENVSDEAERVRRVLEAARQERQEIAAKARAHEAARQEAERIAEEAQKEVDAVKEKMRKFAKAKQQKILDLEEENEKLREQLESRGSKMEDTEMKQELHKVKEEMETLKTNLHSTVAERDSLECLASELREQLAQAIEEKNSTTPHHSISAGVEEAIAVQSSAVLTERYQEPPVDHCQETEVQRGSEKFSEALTETESPLVQPNTEMSERTHTQTEDRLKELEISLEIAESKLRELEAALEVEKGTRGDRESELKTELASLEHQLQESKAREESLKEECLQRDTQLQNLRTNLEAERDDLEERLMNQLAQVNGSIAGYQQEAADCRDRLADLQREVEKLERERAEFEALLENEKDRAARLEEDKRQAQRERAEAEAEAGQKRELEQKLKSTERVKEGSQSRARQLEELLREKQLEVRQMQKDCIEYQERISELGKETKALLLGKDEVQSELKTAQLEIAKVTEEKQRIEAEMSVCKEKLELAQREANQTRTDKLAFEQSARQREAEIKAEAEHTLDEVRYRLGAELKQIELRLEEAYKEREREEEATQEARNVAEATKRQAEELQSRLDESLARLAAFSRSMSSLQNDRDRVMDEAKQWESRFHSALQGKEAEIREGEARAQDLAEQLQKETTLRAELQLSLERLQKAEEQWQQQFEEAEKKHMESMATLEKERGDLQEALTQNEGSLAETRSQLASVETEAEGLRNRAKALEEAVGKLQSEISNIRAELKERETEERRLCLCLEQLEVDLRSSKLLTENLQAELSEKEKREVELLGENERVLTQAVEEARREANSRAEEAEKQLEERRAQVRSLEERLHKAEENASHSKARLDAFTKAMGSLQDDRDRVLSEYKQLEERHVQVMMEKDSLIQEAAGENNSLKEEIRALLAQRDDLNAEKAKLAAQLHGYRDDLNQVLTMKDFQHKQLLSAQLERITVLEKERDELEARIKAFERERQEEVVKSRVQGVELETLSKAGDGEERKEVKDAPGAEVEKLREQLQAAKRQLANLEETLQSERDAQAARSKELSELRWEGGVLRTEAETAEERVAELARDLMVMEQKLLEEREAAAQLHAKNQSFGQAMASLQDSRDQALDEAKELRLRLEEIGKTGSHTAGGSTGEVWSLKNALSALQNDRERLLEQLKWQQSELDKLGAGELTKLTQALDEEKKMSKDRVEKIIAEMKEKDAQLEKDKQELETLRLEQMDWQAQAELLKQQTLATLSDRDHQIRQLSAMLEEAQVQQKMHREENLMVFSAPGGPQEHIQGYKAECVQLQRRLDEEVELRLAVEEQLLAAQDRLKRCTQGDWQPGAEGDISETAVLIEPPEGTVTRTRSSGPGVIRMLRAAFCSRQRTPLLVSLYLLTVHVLLLLCMGGYL
ncbi:golgin subfamily B member 1 [Chanos chanos]|uniref:Golgin subfamily B member 1 n=1 Tax=Chanos chanos TaxID=29144 RepID=A0A6J2VNP3_CHACN|nr:golgin subfamily B member 1 [Chanos chanos]